MPKIRNRHRWSDDEINQHLTFLLANSIFAEVSTVISPALTRDLTDTKFLALAQDTKADFLVTNDHRHLLPLKKHLVTRIVTPTEFLRQLL